jgi:hypothetical protein
MLSRQVSFGGATIGVDYSAGRAAAIVEHLYSSIGCEPSGAPDATLSLIENVSDGIFELSCNGEVRCRDHLDGAIGSWLLHLTTLELASRSTGGLLLHAAAVASDGQCVVLPGSTGAGKTTLTAYLAGRGFRYMTDELTFVADGSTTVEAFVRPLKLKTDGAAALRRENRLQIRESQRLVGPSDVLVSADAFSSTRPLARAQLGGIIFPRYQRRGPLRVEPMSPAQAGFRLIECALNRKVRPDHGFTDVTRLAAAVPSYELRYSSLEQLDDKLGLFRGGGVMSEEHAPAGAGAPQGVVPT